MVGIMKKTFVPEEVTAHFNELKQKGIEKENGWNEQFNLYRESNPALADELEKRLQVKF